MTARPPVYVHPSQLQIGVYVYLDLGWMDHPFTLSHFRIKNDEQLTQLLRLGLDKVRIDPERSTQPPRALVVAAVPPTAPAATMVEAEPSPALIAKRQRIERLKAQRAALAQCEKRYLDAARTINSISRNLIALPQESIADAQALTEQLAQSLLRESEVVIHLMNDKVMGEDVYYHSLNVAMLAMITGRAMHLGENELQQLGMGGIFHDLGKSRIPHKVLIKADKPNKAEADFLQMHVAYGLDIAGKVQLPAAVIQMIAQHHEYMDGSGYPKGLTAAAIDPHSRILAAVNAYDNLCNPVQAIHALTPHEALSLMFSQQRRRWDGEVLSTLIHTLGVYPPGTIVRLNNDNLGMVVSVNPAKPIKPQVLVYDPSTPREEAIILDLTEDDELSISKALRPAQLPTAVYDYLSPRTRVTYFFDGKGARAGSGA